MTTPLIRPPVCQCGVRLLAVALLATLPPTAARAAEPPPFTEVAAEVGLDFVYFNGITGELYFPEVMGGGAALFDADGDGDLDLFLSQGALLGAEETLEDAVRPPEGPLGLHDRLYRNDLEVTGDGERRLGFTDVSADAGLAAGDYGMGVAAGDYDNDGRTDLYVTNYGSNRLLRNEGDLRFADVTEDAHADDPRWSTSATFLDFDRDGWLDLYIVNYVVYNVADNPSCYAPSSRPDYCGPSSFPPVADRLLRNRGDGTFEDVSTAAGIAGTPGPGLGVVATDADGDGWPDLYVANDGAANFLWHNRGDGTFREEGLLAGVAVNAQGRPEAGMGVDAEDYDGDGDEDLIVVHLVSETNTLYVNAGGVSYSDRTAAAGLAAPSLPFTSFGTSWIDYDNDSFLDLLVVNGAVRILEEQAAAGEPFPVAQPNQLFRNRGDGTFEDLSAAAGPAFTTAEASRAAAFGDVDDDGDTDAVVVNGAGPVRLLLNGVGSRSRWLGLRLLDGSGRDALGARVELQREGAPGLWRRAATDGSILAANDPRVLVGLGDGPAATGVTVHWPDGSVERFPAPPEGRYTTLRQGAAPADDGGSAPGKGDGESAAPPSDGEDDEPRDDETATGPSRGRNDGGPPQ